MLLAASLRDVTRGPFRTAASQWIATRRQGGLRRPAARLKGTKSTTELAERVKAVLSFPDVGLARCPPNTQALPLPLPL